MTASHALTRLLAAVPLLLAMPVQAQRPDDAARIAAQREAIARLAFMDGTWRGPAAAQMPAGPHNLTQTEQIGPMLDGTIRVIEGKGFEPDGRASFNAFAVISYDPEAKTYTMRSYNAGRAGDFPLTLTADGFVWEIPIGGATIRYTATVKDGKWREVGERIVPGQPAVPFFEMNLVRVGDTDWPAAGGLPPK